jgi:hypothetical protein
MIKSAPHPILGNHAAVYNLFNLGRHLVGLNTIGISGSVRSQNGVGQLPGPGSVLFQTQVS